MRLTSFVLPPPVTWKGLVLAVGALGHSTEHRRSALSRPALPLEDELPNQSLLPAACYPIEMECDACEVHPAWSEYFGEEIWLCAAIPPTNMNGAERGAKDEPPPSRRSPAYPG